jgi:hypothetical protein
MALSTFTADLVVLLQDAGLGTYGLEIFKGQKAIIPAGSGPYTSIIATGGEGESGTHNLSRTAIAYERPSAQIVCRAAKYEDAETAIQTAYSALNFVDKFVNGTWWRKCRPKQEVMELPLDDKARVRLVFNIESEKRVSPATS